MANNSCERGSGSSMIIPTIILAVVAVVVSIIAYNKNGAHTEGFKAAWDIFIQVLPMMVLAFIIAGMLRVIIPQETISQWLGQESGFKGVLIGTALGGLMPGGPYSCMPSAAGLLGGGAGAGTMVAFMTGWSLLAVNRLPLEIGMLGWKFALIRLAVTALMPIAAGMLANALFSKVNLLE
ncbi:permease [Dehalococcoides mccartyi]|uniref:permease n=1 Tax=Dehalococcoides mccartyi TaxID=61435 RepID=UPI002AFF85C9|nr:permease [Dehalococcoides mccartyi]MEA2123207.1 hypothetical protein [Dehalococcoides mccartyi]